MKFIIVLLMFGLALNFKMTNNILKVVNSETANRVDEEETINKIEEQKIEEKSTTKELKKPEQAGKTEESKTSVSQWWDFDGWYWDDWYWGGWGYFDDWYDYGCCYWYWRTGEKKKDIKSKRELTIKEAQNELKSLLKKFYGDENYSIDKVRENKVYDTKWLIKQFKISRVLEIEDRLKTVENK